jgi:P-type Ca2+ transporter type 2C
MSASLPHPEVAQVGRPRDDHPVGAPVVTSLNPSLRDGVDVARDLGVDPTVGLSATEAARRLAADGPNELQPKPPVPLWRKVLAQFRDPLIYLLLVAVAIALLAWAAEGATGVPIDALVIAAVIVVNGVIGVYPGEPGRERRCGTTGGNRGAVHRATRRRAANRPGK